jgi:hypothetical protein
MNGRRDFGLSISDSNDTKNLYRDESDTTFNSICLLGGLAGLAFICGALIPMLILLGAAVVVGLINWR